MGAVAGNKLVIKVSVDPITSATDGVQLDSADSASYDTSKETFQITGFGDEYQRSMVGLKTLTGSISGTFDKDNEGQRLLRNEDYVYVAFFWAGIDGDADVAQFCVTNFSLSSDVAGRQDFSADLEGYGAAPTHITA